MGDHVAAPGAQTRLDPGVEYKLGRSGAFIRWVVAIYATLTLLGVTVEPVRVLLPSGPLFLREYPGASALPLAVLAWGSLLAGDTLRSTAGVSWRRLGTLLAMLVAGFGGYLTIVFAFRFPDLWPANPDTTLPALWVALMLIVLGLSLLLSVSRIEGRVIVGQVGALIVFSANAVIFLGYVYGDVSVGRLLRPPEITFQASLVSLLIAVGVLLIRPGSGLLATASSPGAGGRMLRRFGPVILLLPALLLFFVEALPTTERIDALALVVVALGVFLLAMLATIVKVIDETKVEASAAAAQAERAKIGLEQEAPVVRSLADALHVVDLPESMSLDVATRFRPGQGSVAGDASAVRTLPDGAVVAVLVDMTGHGAEPAIRAIRVRDVLVHTMALGKSPAEALSSLGWSAPKDILASAIVVWIDPNSGEVSAASAGHPPMIYVGTQETELIGSTGPLLFLDPGVEYGEVRFELDRGDSLVIVSDGIADVQRIRNGRPETEVLADALLGEGGVASRTAELAIGFADPTPSDDQSVLVIRRSG